MYQAIVTQSPEWGECSPLDYQERVQSWGRHLLEQSYPATVMLAIADGVNYHRFVCGLEDANWSIFDSIMVWNYPHPERVVIARTPRQGLTYAQCLERFGTGSLNIDDTRIPTQNRPRRINLGNLDSNGIYGEGKNGSVAIGTTDEGRWGANTILIHHPNCSDELCVSDCHVHIMGEQSGELKSGELLVHHKSNGKSQIGTFNIRDRSGEVKPTYGDTGTASRFFYQARSRQDVMDYLVTLITPPTEKPTLLIQTERILL